MRPLTLNAAPIEIVSAGARLELPRGEVAVWCVPLDEVADELLSSLEESLSSDERERARSFYFERDRRRFSVGRGLLRTLLGDYLNRSAAEVVFRYGSHGKPELADDTQERSGALHFNLAHSEGVAVYAFSRSGAVGIDVEKMRDLPDWQQVAEAIFPAHELSRLRATAAEERRDEFFRTWTRHEALLKATGAGLAGKADARQRDFSVHPFTPAPGFAGALAAGPDARTATLTHWRPVDPWAPRKALPSQRVRLDQLAASRPNFL